MDCAKEHSIERFKYYESDKSSWFYEDLCRFNILCNRWLVEIFAVDIYYHKSCYIKHTISPIRKSDENRNSKKDRNKYRHVTFLVFTAVLVF